jgi:hypothetical protein
VTNLADRIEKVAWLGDLPPPKPLLSYLERQGIALVRPADSPTLPPARLTTLDAIRDASSITRASGSRVALVHPDAGTAEAIATVLRSKGAQVVTLRPSDSVERIQGFVPDAVLVDATDLHRSCWRFVRALFSHPWLRFSPLLLAPPGSLHVPMDGAWDLPGLCAGLHLLHQSARKVTALARKQSELSLSLDQLGAARMLRALMDSERSLRIRVDTQDHTLFVDVVGPLVFGAFGGPRREGEPSKPAELPLVGPAALAVLLQCDEGVVSVRECERLTVTNIMAPLASALHGTVSPLQPRDVNVMAPPVQARPAPMLLQFASDARRGSRSARDDDRTLTGLGTGRGLAAAAGPRARPTFARSADEHTLVGVGKLLNADQPARAALARKAFDNTLVGLQRGSLLLEANRASLERRAVDSTLVGIGTRASQIQEGALPSANAAPQGRVTHLVVAVPQAEALEPAQADAPPPLAEAAFSDVQPDSVHDAEDELHVPASAAGPETLLLPTPPPQALPAFDDPSSFVTPARRSEDGMGQLLGVLVLAMMTLVVLLVWYAPSH